MASLRPGNLPKVQELRVQARKVQGLKAKAKRHKQVNPVKVNQGKTAKVKTGNPDLQHSAAALRHLRRQYYPE